MVKSPLNDYALIDAGDFVRVERFGEHVIERPCSQAVWPLSSDEVSPDATFSRDGGKKWSGELPERWALEHGGVKFSVRPTDFGHLGLFPEHAEHWPLFEKHLEPGDRVLNLFAYTGGASLAAAKAGMQVCHVDASKPTTEWARENAKLNDLEEKPIRWIVDDAVKFLKKEIRRESFYNCVVLDPPTFGRGNKGQVFKIEEEILPLLELCRAVMDEPKLLVLTSHTPGFTPVVLERLARAAMPEGSVESGENCLVDEKGEKLPLGAFARWNK